MQITTRTKETVLEYLTRELGQVSATQPRWAVLNRMIRDLKSEIKDDDSRRNLIWPGTVLVPRRCRFSGI